MPKQSLDGAGRYSYHYPRLTVIVTSHSKGKDNAMTVAWHSPISLKPPLYGIAITSSRSTYELIMESKEFGINLLTFKDAELMASVGGSKGKDLDKFDKFHIAKDKALKTSVPVLKDAYLAYECKLIDHKPYGDHEWMVGEIVAVHILEEAFTAEGILNVTQVDPALYLGGEIYLTTLKDTQKRLNRNEYGRRHG
jgi:flavin reductase (DIM6/NTAB) family NADH-FMN oxidoreductase RutF